MVEKVYAGFREGIYLTSVMKTKDSSKTWAGHVFLQFFPLQSTVTNSLICRKDHTFWFLQSVVWVSRSHRSSVCHCLSLFSHRYSRNIPGMLNVLRVVFDQSVKDSAHRRSLWHEGLTYWIHKLEQSVIVIGTNPTPTIAALPLGNLFKCCHDTISTCVLFS